MPANLTHWAFNINMYHLWVKTLRSFINFWWFYLTEKIHRKCIFSHFMPMDTVKCYTLLLFFIPNETIIKQFLVSFSIVHSVIYVWFLRWCRGYQFPCIDDGWKFCLAKRSGIFVWGTRCEKLPIPYVAPLCKSLQSPSDTFTFRRPRRKLLLG